MTATLKERVENSEARFCLPEAFYSNDTACRIQAGIDSFRRGKGEDAGEVFAELRKKHGTLDLPSKAYAGCRSGTGMFST